jgi:hypothetical protein
MPPIEEATMKRKLQSMHFDSRATAARPSVDSSDEAFDVDADPYGPVEPDEESWFAPVSRGGHAGARDEREVRAFVEHLVGG